MACATFTHTRRLPEGNRSTSYASARRQATISQGSSVKDQASSFKDQLARRGFMRSSAASSSCEWRWWRSVSPCTPPCAFSSAFSVSRCRRLPLPGVVAGMVGCFGSAMVVLLETGGKQDYKQELQTKTACKDCERLVCHGGGEVGARKAAVALQETVSAAPPKSNLRLSAAAGIAAALPGGPPRIFRCGRRRDRIC